MGRDKEEAANYGGNSPQRDDTEYLAYMDEEGETFPFTDVDLTEEDEMDWLIRNDPFRNEDGTYNWPKWYDYLRGLNTVISERYPKGTD